MWCSLGTLHFWRPALTQPFFPLRPKFNCTHIVLMYVLPPLIKSDASSKPYSLGLLGFFSLKFGKHLTFFHTQAITKKASMNKNPF